MGVVYSVYYGAALLMRLLFRLLAKLFEAIPGEVREFVAEIVPPRREKTWSDLFKEQIEKADLPLWVWVLAGLLVAYIGLSILRKIFGNWVYNRMREFVFGLRGIQYESLQPGSVPTAQAETSYQVSIVDVGLFTTTHVGYGIRVRNVLVVPIHVKNSVRVQPGLQKNGQTVLFSWVGAESRCLRDTFYVFVRPEVFSTLGVTAAPKARISGRATPVSIAGPKLGSEGLLQPSSTMGILLYSGSTLPGFSGAPYYDATRWYGQHTGAMSSSNCGVSALVVEKEVLKLVQHESNHEDATPLHRSEWHHDSNVHDWVDEMYDHEDGDADMILDYGNEEGDAPMSGYGRRRARTSKAIKRHAKVFYESLSSDEFKKLNFAELSKKELESLITSLDGISTRVKTEHSTKTLKANGEGITSGKVEVGPVKQPTLRERIEALENRVQKLENPSTEETEVAKEAQPQVEAEATVSKFFCCGKEFKKRFDLLQHQRDFCRKVQPESAWPSDSVKFVKTTKNSAFLGKRLAPESSKKLKNISKQKETGVDPSLVLQASLSRMESMMTQLVQNLNPLLQGMAGPSSATKPN